MSNIQVPPNSTGSKVDTRVLTDGSDSVHRQVVNIGDPTNIANIGAVDANGSQQVALYGAAATGGRLPVVLADGNIISGSVSAAGDIINIDATGYESVCVQVTSAGTTCTISYEASNDGTTWYSVAGYTPLNTGSTGMVTSSTTAILLVFPTIARYFRARCSTYTSGTVAITAIFRKSPCPKHGVSIASNTSTGLVISGATAHDAAVTSNSVRAGARAVATNYTAVQTGDAADLISTLVGALVSKPYSIPEAEWASAAVAGGITGTADTALAAAPAAGLKNYLTGISFQNAHATTATEVVVKDGATVIFRGYLGAGSSPNSSLQVNFANPLKCTAATALNVACITTGAQVYVNAQGYVAP